MFNRATVQGGVKRRLIELLEHSLALRSCAVPTQESRVEAGDKLHNYLVVCLVVVDDSKIVLVQSSLDPDPLLSLGWHKAGVLVLVDLGHLVKRQDVNFLVAKIKPGYGFPHFFVLESLNEYKAIHILDVGC